jgi:hypothetical protein
MKTFPTIHRLWSGVILSTIAHAVWIFADPLLSYEKSWDGLNYNAQDSMGTQGTVTFAGDRVIGIFFDENSPRNPIRSKTEYDVHTFFREASPDILALAQNETLQYLLRSYKGTLTPLITSAFWNEGGILTAGEPWSEVILHGAHLIHRETLQTDIAMAELQNDYEFSSSQLTLVQSLFQRKMKKPHSSIFLESKEIAILKENGDDGFTESCDLFAAIGIHLQDNNI